MRRLLLLVCICLPLQCFATEQSITRIKLWTDLAVSGHMDDAKKYDYIAQLHLRHADQPSIIEERALRLGLGYQLSPRNHFMFAIHLSGDIPFDENSPEREFRFQQQLDTIWLKTAKVISTFRTRVEERKEFGEPSWSFRFRERLKFRFIPPKNYTLQPITFSEIILNINNPEWVNSNVVDQLRFFAGFSKEISEHWEFQFGYQNQLKIRERNIINNIAILSFEYKCL